MRIYIIRHGQTEYNKLKIVQGSGVDSSLNDTGRSQANAFYQKYKDIPFEAVLTSALKRTKETVQPFLEQQIPTEAFAEINEINWGVHEGKESTSFMINAYKDLIGKWGKGDFDARLEEGESANELQKRLNHFLDHLKSRTEKNILVCSHGRTLRCLMCLLEKKHLREMENYSHHNTGLFIVDLVDNEFKVVSLNDTSHLA